MQIMSIITTRYTKIILTSTIAFMLLFTALEAGQVTMSSFDFDDDGCDEIIRTDEKNAHTNIKIYKRIDNSFFYSPSQEFRAIGRLVQVPEIIDINKDGRMDYYFATGSDMGVIYYDQTQDQFIRTNEFDFNANGYDTAQVNIRKKDSGVRSLQQTLHKISEADYELHEIQKISEHTRQPMILNENTESDSKKVPDPSLMTPSREIKKANEAQKQTVVSGSAAIL